MALKSLGATLLRDSGRVLYSCYYCMEVPEAKNCDEEGLVGKLAIPMTLLSHELRLPFYRPLRDILDHLGLAPTQLHLFALWVYLCTCIVFCMALELLDDFHPDLTA